ncbi:hypothetical protein J4Q44_G00376030 [Coregonus suidteri]|uniref:VWFD domain-containing protein n=1 Tax=Coregonus suidteri TaxID=861788 RepID=A0AAN8KHY9_9TELE
MNTTEAGESYTGNFNDQPGDDNIKPYGKPAGNTNELGESWQVPDDRPDCTHGGGEEECDAKVEAEAEKPTSCGMISDPNGIFKPCHAAIESYADLCALAGVPIAWRNNTFCPLKCLPGSHYEPCGNACPSSCQNPTFNSTCTQPCVEGRVCDPGMILSGDKCVPPSQCGCTDEDNNYRPVGDSWFTELDCSERCKCNPGNNVTCEPWQCSPAQECKLNRHRVRTPLSIGVAGARVLSSGVYSLLDTDFGLKVKFDGVHHLEITIPGEYFNQLPEHPKHAQWVTCLEASGQSWEDSSTDVEHLGRLGLQAIKGGHISLP